MIERLELTTDEEVGAYRTSEINHFISNELVSEPEYRIENILGQTTTYCDLSDIMPIGKDNLGKIIETK